MSRTPPTPTPPLRRVDQLLQHYASSHQHPVNEAIHMVAIPCIMFSLCGLIYSVYSWAVLFFLMASLTYYSRLSMVFFITMLVVSMLILLGIQMLMPHVLSVSLGLFVVAWIGQFIGHHIEGKKPSFFEDIQYLWVGPLFVLSRLFIKIGIKW